MTASQTVGQDASATTGAGPDGAPEAGSQPAPAVRGPVRRRWRRRIVLGTAAGLGILWWVGWASPLTLVEHVTVAAPSGISAESLRLASGISVADHVPNVDEQAVRLAIMTALPAVADVKLERILPHTIALRVTARSPLAAVQEGSRYLVMDADGVIYDRVRRAKDLPIIKAGTEANRQVAREVLLAIPGDLRSRVTQVTARSRDNVTLGLREGETVAWGGVEDSELKARVLTGLMVVKATRYDVSAPLLPTTSGSPPESAGASG